MNYIRGLVLIVLIVEASSIELPSDFQVCDRHSPSFLECTSRAATDAIVSLSQGLKSFKIFPLEPLQAGDVTIGKSGGPVSVKQSYKNAKLYGLTKGFKLDYEAIDFDKLVFRSKAFNDQVDFVADYTMDGQILLLPIRGKGHSNVTMLGLKTKATMECEKFEKDGETYLRVLKYDCKFTPSKVLLDFTNLFNGDPVLSAQMNKFLNENSDLVFKETQKEYEETFSLIFAKIANDIFSRVPMNKIFLLENSVIRTVKMKYFVGLIIAVFVVVESNAAHLPSHFKKCSYKSPNFKDCLSSAVADAIVSMAGGLKSFKILPLDPLAVDSVSIGDNGGVVSIQQDYQNVKVHGLAQGLRLKYEYISDDLLTTRSVAWNDRVDFVGDYALNGKVLILPITGKGRANITMFDLQTVSTVHCEKYEKNGEQYVRTTKYEVKLIPKKVMYNFTNLFNGDEVLGTQMNKFLNENWEVVFKETQESFEETFGLLFVNIANNILSRVPLSELFPDE
ncbi:uncharacterized protein [Venturia canescens]|uniref:uncharacterized protein n=1 Tax=Venturia canescens TaxID=32260 RepID=UPI001C9C023F|nr:uncharacterized protein LOC122419000 [Venturia canescens]